MNTIKAIISDVDGTVYESNNELSKALEDFGIGKVVERFNLSPEKARQIYLEKKVELASATKAMVELGIGGVLEVTKMVEEAVWDMKTKVIRKDERLVNMVKALKQRGYNVYTLRNGSLEGTKKTLRLLGFEDEHFPSLESETRRMPANEIYQSFGPFDGLIPTVETGRMKPDSAILEDFLTIMGFQPEECLIVGDRINVDLVPAKEVGMQTALVTWGEKIAHNPDVDYCLQTIYDVEELVNGK